MPRRIESSLLVVEGFKDRGGVEHQAGDRLSLRSRNVRLAALERPELFVMEYETAPVDLDWLRELDQRYEAEYQAVRAARGTAEERRQQALRTQLAEQERPDPKDLERRFKQQEKERAERQKQAADERERQAIERELAYGSGFHA